jgi:hypothetical protein
MLISNQLEGANFGNLTDPDTEGFRDQHLKFLANLTDIILRLIQEFGECGTSQILFFITLKGGFKPK